MLARGTRTISAVLLVAALSVGCSTRPSADADYFAGLDSTVVAEVLANPVVQERVGHEPREQKETRLQGIVINFIVCRDLYRVYQAWITNGDLPEPNPLPVPDDPRADWPSEFSGVLDAARSGDPELLRTVLTVESSCGAWIPLTPGDISGPTIADAVRDLS